jgi:hypothetical protein
MEDKYHSLKLKGNLMETKHELYLIPKMFSSITELGSRIPPSMFKASLRKLCIIKRNEMKRKRFIFEVITIQLQE